MRLESFTQRGYRRGTPPEPRGTVWAAEHTGATPRQLYYWGGLGLLGPEHQRVGSGGRRRFSDHDLEVAYALVHLSAIGCGEHWLASAAAAIRSRRVASAGEWLVVGVDAGVQWFDADTALIDLPAPCWLVRLHPFAAGAPQ